jgi:hypothetical protein
MDQRKKIGSMPPNNCVPAGAPADPQQRRAL